MPRYVEIDEEMVSPDVNDRPPMPTPRGQRSTTIEDDIQEHDDINSSTTNNGDFDDGLYRVYHSSENITCNKSNIDTERMSSTLPTKNHRYLNKL